MKTTRLLFNLFPAKSRASGGVAKYLIAAAGAATFTYRSLNADDQLFLPTSSYSSTDFPRLYAVVRCSRAMFTIAYIVSDYKYSLRGISAESDEYRNVLSEVHLRSAKRMLELCESNRGFYVKAGQFAAAVRQVPNEYSSTLSSLQDQTVPCPFKAIKDLLISSFGRDLSEIFISFDEQPIAAASIAQVHHAVLKDHQEVAVKVQYPGLEDQMKFDLAAMSFLSNSIAWFFPEYRFGWLVSEFAKSISSELAISALSTDFIQEAKNSQRVATNFRNNRKVRIPDVFLDLTTTQVLTMEFCKGQKVDDLTFLNQVGISPIKVAQALSEVVAEMVFVHGFLHVDLHPGNILVSSEGQDDFSLVLLDFGICRELNEAFRVNYCKLWKALTFMDSRNIKQLSDEMGVGKFYRFFPVIFMGRPISRIIGIIVSQVQRFYSRRAIGKEMSAEEKSNVRQEINSLKMDLSTIMESLPPDFVTVLRTDGLLMSLISKLGAPRKVRIRSYAKCALRGISTKTASADRTSALEISLCPNAGFPLVSDSAIKSVFYRLGTGIQSIQVRLLFDVLELIGLIEKIGHSLSMKFKKLLNSAGSMGRNLLILLP